MADLKLYRYDINKFMGINQSKDEFDLSSGETVDCQNMIFDNNNLAVTPGTIKYIADDLAQDITCLMSFFKNTANGVEKIIIAASADALYAYKGGQWITLLLNRNGGDYRFLNYQQGTSDIIIMSNGVDDPIKYDGTLVSFLGGSPPSMREMALNYERIWALGEEPNRVYYSDDLNPENWSNLNNNEGGFIDIPTWDGGVCIGLSTLFDDVCVFKNYNIWKINGTYPDEYNISKVYSSVGSIAPRSIVDAGSVAFFLDRSGIYVYDGMQTFLISQNICKLINDMNSSYVNNAVGVFWHNKYILAIPEGNDTVNNTIIEYDIVTKIFCIKRGVRVDSFIKYDDDIDVLLFSNGSKYVMRYNYGDDFDGVPIDAYYYTPDTNFDMPDQSKLSRNFYFLLENLYGNEIKIKLESDSGDIEKNVGIAAGENDKKIYLRNRCKKFRYKISNVSGSRFVIKQAGGIFEG